MNLNSKEASALPPFSASPISKNGQRPDVPLFKGKLVRQSCSRRYRQGRLFFAMEISDRLANALKNLTAALDLLDAAVERRAQADAARADLEQELAVMQEDRARLAEDLDLCLDRTETLRAANHEVAKRLDRIGAVLQDSVAALEAYPSSVEP